MQFDKLQMDFFNLKDPVTKPFHLSNKLNIPMIIEDLISIIELLKETGHTLSYLCPDDFVLKDNHLFLYETGHIVKIDDPIKIKKGCFHAKGLKATMQRTYASVGVFVFFLYTRKTKTSIKEEDYGKLVGTKAYYFIKNTQGSNPILFYL